jgi:hypothetical protein
MVDNRYRVNVGSVFSLKYHLCTVQNAAAGFSGYTTRFATPEELPAVSTARDILRRGRNQS